MPAVPRGSISVKQCPAQKKKEARQEGQPLVKSPSSSEYDGSSEGSLEEERLLGTTFGSWVTKWGTFSHS